MKKMSKAIVKKAIAWLLVANVITFGGKRVFGPTEYNIDVDLGQPYGWVSARVCSRDAEHNAFAVKVVATWRVRAAWRCGFYRVIARTVAESMDPGLKSFYGPFWMLRLRAA